MIITTCLIFYALMRIGSEIRPKKKKKTVIRVYVAGKVLATSYENPMIITLSPLADILGFDKIEVTYE